MWSKTRAEADQEETGRPGPWAETERQRSGAERLCGHWWVRRRLQTLQGQGRLRMKPTLWWPATPGRVSGHQCSLGLAPWLGLDFRDSCAITCTSHHFSFTHQKRSDCVTRGPWKHSRSSQHAQVLGPMGHTTALRHLTSWEANDLPSSTAQNEMLGWHSSGNQLSN